MTKKLLSLLSLGLIANIGFSQAIINGDFENWTNVPIETVDGAEMSQYTSVSTDKTEGQFAAKLENKLDGNQVDAGVVLFGRAGQGGIDGGVPYTGTPDSLVGYAKYDIKPGDAALVLVNFWVNGSSTAVPNIFQITGSSSGFVRLAFKLNVGGVVDSAALGLTSGNFMASPALGGWIIWDDVKFVGINAGQINNTNFENWTNKGYDEINSWNTSNASAAKDKKNAYTTKSISSYQNMFAVKTIADIHQNGNNSYDNGMVKNYQYITNGKIGGFPFTISSDTIIFWYKLSGTGNGQIGVELSSNGSNVGGNTISLPATNNYTMMKVPFNCSSTPDTIRIAFSASEYPYNQNQNGNELIIDNIQLMSEFTVGISEINTNSITVYPNPVENQMFVNFSSEKAETISIDIYTMEGKLINSTLYNCSAGNNKTSVSTANLSAGLYQYVLKNDKGIIASGSIIK